MIKKANPSDILELQKICKESYFKVFSDHWNKEGCTLYLENQFGTKRLKVDLVDENYGYFFIVEENLNIGFLKVHYKHTSEFSKLNNCELQKIYILPKFSGKGIGKQVLAETIANIRNLGKEEIFLDVLDTNVSSIAFYKRMGFKIHSKR